LGPPPYFLIEDRESPSLFLLTISPGIFFVETERPPQDGFLTAISFEHHKLAGFDEGGNGWAVNLQKEIEGLDFLVF
jgi:hypothetical protein